jgi:hypothetical protein
MRVELNDLESRLPAVGRNHQHALNHKGFRAAMHPMWCMADYHYDQMRRYLWQHL